MTVTAVAMMIAIVAVMVKINNVDKGIGRNADTFLIEKDRNMKKGLYIHIPFCKKKCLYCDFVSKTGCEDKFDAYISAVLREGEEYRGEKIDSIFVGGGTPTILNERQLKKLLTQINKIFDIDANAEITCEGNPGTISTEKISLLSDCGINRMSVGVQSFNDDELKVIGRIHTSDEAYNTVQKIKSGGIDNINIDLMTALPKQTPKSLAYTLRRAVELPITHISVYSLIIEDGTPLEREYSQGRLILPDEDTDREMYHSTVEFLRKNGFEQYEISNFTKRGLECKHNLKYWNCDEYIGLGVAAHSYIENKRFCNSSDINEYITNNKREYTLIPEEDKISEFMMLGLRKNNGVSELDFYERFGKTIQETFGEQLQKFIRLGLMKKINDSYCLTERGIDVSNSVMCEFIL